MMKFLAPMMLGAARALNSAEKALPGVAPEAKQQGAYLARVIRARIDGRPSSGLSTGSGRRAASSRGPLTVTLPRRIEPPAAFCGLTVRPVRIADGREPALLGRDQLGHLGVADKKRDLMWRGLRQHRLQHGRPWHWPVSNKVRRDEFALTYWTLTLVVWGGTGLIGFLLLTGLFGRLFGFR